MTGRSQLREAIIGRIRGYGAHLRANGRVLGIAAAVLAVSAIAFVWSRRVAGFWGIDDAGITYAASFELADHGSLAMNVEGTPVESYSNPLVFFVVALLRWLGLFDPVSTHVYIETAMFGAMVLLVWALLRRTAGEVAALGGAAVFAVIELATPATWLWYGSGLENLWVSAGLVLLLWLCVRTAGGAKLGAAWGLVPGLVALTRPEAPVYVAGFYVALAAFARPRDVGGWTHLRRVIACALVTALVFVAFLTWRRIGYGDWWPNTAYAKMSGPPVFRQNLRVSVIQNILPYARSGMLACSAIVLVAVPRFRRVAGMLVVMSVVSLALPITAGEDLFMGEHRFATPFLAMTHASYAALVAACLVFLVAATARAKRIVAAVLVAAVAVLPALVVHERLERAPLYLDVVSIARIAEIQGGRRWEHQMRLGVPYAVGMLPDVGGAVLVGGFQLVDDAYLADFDLAHQGRWGDMRMVSQYHGERYPDLIDPSTGIGRLDEARLRAGYLTGPYHMMARRDLVEVPAIDPAARLVFDDGHLQIYVSPDTVPVVGPRGLIRVELIVAWNDVDLSELELGGRIAGGDRDKIPLQPYQPGSSGRERRALLLGAPNRTGSAEITFELRDRGHVIATASAGMIDVASDDLTYARTAGELLADRSPVRAARRLAWLREQAIPRYGMTRFQVIKHALLTHDARRERRAGRNILRLRWTARLATFEDLPRGIRIAEATVARRVFERCEPASDDVGLAARAACLGRAVDELRRYGYLGILDQAPDVAAELARAGSIAERVTSPTQRYQLLVGATFGDPGNIGLRRRLIATRRILETYPPLPVFVP